MRNVQVSKSSSTQPSRLQRGFTLIEVMIVVAIVAILAAVAIPNYRDYVLRGQLVDASSLLSTFRANMERYYQDNRQYTNISATIVAPCDGSVPVAQRTQGKFIVTCSAVAANTYTLLAQGQGSVLNFNFTVDQTGGQATPSVGASGWSTSTTCWVMKKGQVC